MYAILHWGDKKECGRPLEGLRKSKQDFNNQQNILKKIWDTLSLGQFC